MADSLTFDLVSPAKKLASFTVSQVVIPSAAGDMTAMPGHAPTVATLRPGLVRAFTAEGEKVFLVIGGFAEISNTSVTVLAEEAEPRETAGPERVAALIEKQEKLVASLEADSEARLGAEARLNDLRNLEIVLRA